MVGRGVSVGGHTALHRTSTALQSTATPNATSAFWDFGVGGGYLAEGAGGLGVARWSTLA